MEYAASENILQLDRCNPAQEFCEAFLRQLLIIYHFIHYRLDRPFLPDQVWEEYCNLLKTELERSLIQNGIPENWLKDLFWEDSGPPGKKRRSLRYEVCRQPLFIASKAKIEATLEQLRKIESSARRLPSGPEKSRHYREELAKICKWALQNAWEVTHRLGFDRI